MVTTSGLSLVRLEAYFVNVYKDEVREWVGSNLLVYCIFKNTFQSRAKI